MCHLQGQEEKKDKEKRERGEEEEIRKPLLMNEGKVEIILKNEEKRNILIILKRKDILKDSTLTVV